MEDAPPRPSNAADHHAPSDSAADLQTSLPFVRWGQGPLCFDLASDDTEILQRAATITAAWPAPPSARLSRRWRVNRAQPIDGPTQWEAYTSSADDEVTQFFNRGTPAALMQAIEFDAVRELLECREEILALHAALVSRTTPAGERGVALVGPCFCGKSTLSCTLWNSGWSFLGDDVTLFDDNGFAYPGPRRASMRRSSRDLIGDALWGCAAATPAGDLTNEGLLFHPHEVKGAARPQRAKLTAIVFLARLNATAEPAALQRLAPVDGALALLPYSNLRKTSFPAALSRLAPLAETVPIYDLGRGPLDAMIARLNRLMDDVAEP
jgi:hypothetical protein